MRDVLSEVDPSEVLPAGEIARRCGFASGYHFSRRVRQEAGVSPTAVRRRRWERRW
jgi:AraC-like DNA-binding protein